MELIKRVGIKLLGVAVVLGWWTLRGSGPDTTQRATSVPAVVWEGGTPVSIDAACSQPGKLHLGFGRPGHDKDANEEALEVNVVLEPGEHHYEIKVPGHVHGYVELGIDKPPVGAKASVSVRVGDKVAAEDSNVLDGPLPQGTAFFAQVHMQDYAAGEAD